MIPAPFDYRRPETRACRALAAALLLAAAAPAPAQQDYPSRSIRIITAAAQGGTTDLLARTFGVRLGESLKQPVVVDNRASASGVIAGEMTAAAPPDGYTLLLAYHQHTVNAALNPKLPYHPVDSFTPITQLTTAGLMLVVNPSSPPTNARGVRRLDGNFQGALNFGSAGIGSGGHLAGELYKQMTGVKATHIPYKGAGPAMVDLIAGQYHFNFAGLQGAQPLVRAGRLRAIAVTTPKRVPSLPDLPAVAEALPGFEVVGWYGVIGPAKLPAPIVARLHDELVRILNLPDVRERHRGRRLGAGRDHAGGVPRVHGGRRRQVVEAGEGERGEAGLKRRQRAGVVGFSDEADLPPRLWLRRSHQSANRVEYDLELPVIAAFQLIEPLRQRLVRRDHFPQTNESAHHLHAHLFRARAVEHVCGHDGAVLGEA